MRIKKLEWKEDGEDFWQTKIGSRNNLIFEIWKPNEIFILHAYYTENTITLIGDYPTLQEAQDAAQAALEEYVKGFCLPDPLDSQIEALIRQNFELKGKLGRAEKRMSNCAGCSMFFEDEVETKYIKAREAHNERRIEGNAD